MTSNSNNYEQKIFLPDGNLFIKYESNRSKSNFTDEKSKNTPPFTDLKQKTVTITDCKRKPLSRLPPSDTNYLNKQHYKKERISSKQCFTNIRKSSREVDIFISYSHKENERSVIKNWVDRFVQDFLSELQTKAEFKNFRYKSNIWFDKECLNSAQRVMPTIISKVKSTKVFVGLISDSYIGSENCKEEWSTFLKHNSYVNNFFMVPIRPVVHEDLPKPIRDVSRSHHFCYKNNGKQFGPLMMKDKKHKRQYIEKLSMLADAVADSLNKIKNR